MSVGFSRIQALLRGLMATSADTRGTAADSVSDLTRALDATEAGVVSRILLWLALLEKDDTAKEAQLHALADLAEFGLVPIDVLADVRLLPSTGLHGSSVEHFDYLQSLPIHESDLN